MSEPFVNLRRRSGLAWAAMGALSWSLSPVNANATPPSPGPFSASGEFDVKIGAAEMMPAPEGAPAMARRRLDKQYRGDLQGQAVGEMQAAGQPQAGEAAYTALESFTGTLQGRRGGFALAHLGLMHAGGQDLRIAIVPGSGSGELAGIHGELLLRIEGGVHHYTLHYQLG